MRPTTAVALALMILIMVYLVWNRPQPQAPTHNYSICVGSAVVCVRYRTDSYRIEDGMVAFTTSDGLDMRVPLTNIHGIVEHRRQP